MQESTRKFFSITELYKGILLAFLAQTGAEYDHICNSRRTLASLARVCKLTSEGALDVLWSNLRSVKYQALLGLLPRDAYRIEDGEYTYGVSVVSTVLSRWNFTPHPLDIDHSRNSRARLTRRIYRFSTNTLLAYEKSPLAVNINSYPNSTRFASQSSRSLTR